MSSSPLNLDNLMGSQAGELLANASETGTETLDPAALAEMAGQFSALLGQAFNQMTPSPAAQEGELPQKSDILLEKPVDALESTGAIGQGDVARQVLEALTQKQAGRVSEGGFPDLSGHTPAAAPIAVTVGLQQAGFKHASQTSQVPVLSSDTPEIPLDQTGNPDIESPALPGITEPHGAAMTAAQVDQGRSGQASGTMSIPVTPTDHSAFVPKEKPLAPTEGVQGQRARSAEVSVSDQSLVLPESANARGVFATSSKTLSSVSVSALQGLGHPAGEMDRTSWSGEDAHNASDLPDSADVTVERVSTGESASKVPNTSPMPMTPLQTLLTARLQDTPAAAKLDQHQMHSMAVEVRQTPEHAEASALMESASKASETVPADNAHTILNQKLASPESGVVLDDVGISHLAQSLNPKAGLRSDLPGNTATSEQGALSALNPSPSSHEMQMPGKRPEQTTQSHALASVVNPADLERGSDSTTTIDPALAQQSVLPGAASSVAQPPGLNHSAPASDSTLPTFVSQSGTPVEQVVEGTAYSVKNGHKELVIRLNPENLGEVRVTLTSHGNQEVSARLIASTQESHALLQGQIQSLKTSLESQGIQVERLSVVLAGSDTRNDLGANSQQQSFGQQHSGQQSAPKDFNQQQDPNTGGFNAHFNAGGDGAFQHKSGYAQQPGQVGYGRIFSDENIPPADADHLTSETGNGFNPQGGISILA